MTSRTTVRRRAAGRGNETQAETPAVKDELNASPRPPRYRAYGAVGSEVEDSPATGSIALSFAVVKRSPR
ncbi:conserved hypothetical protein [Burkholderia sp. 8Y]|nr:conserved hypothetical protein [Burkholderia sp. 8Y]